MSKQIRLTLENIFENFTINRAPIRLPFQNFELFHDFFNMTMTYRLDADVLFRYGFVKEYYTKKFIAPALSPGWKIPPENYTSKFIFTDISI